MRPPVRYERFRETSSEEKMQETLVAWAPRALAVLRIVTALLFIEHGTQKYFRFPASEYFPEPVAVFSLMGLAGFLEIVGGS